MSSSALEGNVVVSDAFSGYNKIANDVIRAGCWAHVRRKWKEAMPSGATPENCLYTFVEIFTHTSQPETALKPL